MINKLLQEITPLQEQLNNHVIYENIHDLNTLRLFMKRHVFAVFDFMSLAKALQDEFAPSGGIWFPPKNPKLARFVNEIILAEESDLLFNDESTPLSHFEIYLKAMEEVSADTTPINEFIQNLRTDNQDVIGFNIPNSCKNFMSKTFKVIQDKKLNRIAAYFCFGREKVIPSLFESLLEKSKIQKSDAPIFNFYLKRHIEVDGESHGPLAIELIKEICSENNELWLDTIDYAKKALLDRLEFWDSILEEMKDKRVETSIFQLIL